MDLSTLTSVVLGFLLATAIEHYRRDERKRAIATTLRVEAERILRAIGPRLEQLVETQGFAAAPADPEVHSFVHGLIAEGANVDPELVRHFLELDLALKARAKMMGEWRSAAAEARRVRASWDSHLVARAAWARGGTGPPEPESGAAAAVRESEAQARFFERQGLDADQRVRDALEAIITRARRVDDSSLWR